MARVIRVTAPGMVEVQEVDDKPIHEGLVRIEAHYLGISAGTELNTYRGGVNWHAGRDENGIFYADAQQRQWQYPATLGYGHVGRVIEVGADVDHVQVGQMVLSSRPHMDPLLAPANHVWPIPNGHDPRKYIFKQLVHTALNITHHACPNLGETVVVFGAGVVGLITTALLRRAGATHLIVMEPMPYRREMAERFGAHQTFDPTAGDPAYYVRDHNNGRGADVAVETSANEKALQQCPRVVERAGRVVLGSMPNQPMSLHFGQEVHFNGISITGANVTQQPNHMARQWDRARRDALAVQMLAELDLLPLITHEYRFDDAPQAYEKLDKDPSDVISVMLRCPAAQDAV